jgi:hypothetical protein
LMFLLTAIPHSALALLPFERVAFYAGPRNHADYLYFIEIGRPEFARAYLNGLLIQEFLGLISIAISIYQYTVLVKSGDLRCLRAGALLYAKASFPIMVGVAISCYYLFLASDGLGPSVSWFADVPNRHFPFIPQSASSLVFLFTAWVITTIGVMFGPLLAILMSATVGR